MTDCAEALDMSRFFILLIENRISVTAEVVSTLGQHLDSFTLSITTGISKAMTESGQPQVILLGTTLVSDGLSAQLSKLKAVYPDVPIILLASLADLTGEENVLKALLLGATDFCNVSKAGFITLGRRLANLQNSWLNRPSPSSPTIRDALRRAIGRDPSQLSMQLISPDNRLQAWNQAAETFFGIKRDQVIGRSIDELPLSANSLGRLKDILDQVRTTNQPFFIPLYHLKSQQHDRVQQVHVHAYPIFKNLPAQPNALRDVCIIITKLPDLKGQFDAQHLHHNQELQILLEANRQISGQLELAPTLEKVIEQTRALLYGDNCQIYFLEKDNKTLRPVLAVGPLSNQLQTISLTLGQGLIGQLAATGKAVIINTIDPKSEILYAKDEHLLCAPLTAVGGTIGLMIVSRRPKSFNKDDLYFFETLVQQASSAITNPRLF